MAMEFTIFGGIDHAEQKQIVVDKRLSDFAFGGFGAEGFGGRDGDTNSKS